MSSYRIGGIVQLSKRRIKREVAVELRCLGKLPRKKKKRISKLLKLNKSSVKYQIVNIT